MPDVDYYIRDVGYYLKHTAFFIHGLSAQCVHVQNCACCACNLQALASQFTKLARNGLLFCVYVFIPSSTRFFICKFGPGFVQQPAPAHTLSVVGLPLHSFGCAPNVFVIVCRCCCRDILSVWDICQ